MPGGVAGAPPLGGPLCRSQQEIVRVHCEGRAPEEPLFAILDARKTLKAINAIAGTSVQGAWFEGNVCECG